MNSRQIFFFLLFAINGVVFAQTIPLQQYSLKNLDSLCVVVEKVPSSLHSYGVSTKELQLYASQILSEGGFTIVPSANIKQVSGMPFLHISFGVNLLEEERLVVYQIEISLFQKVLFYRDTSIRASNRAAYYGITWSKSQSGSIGDALLWQIKQYVFDILENIVNDGIKTNPKRPICKDIAEIERNNSYGYTQSNPVKVGGYKNDEGPKNERTFLESLRDTSGNQIEFKRLANCCMFETPNGPKGGGLLDIYEVQLKGQSDPIILYLNMYDYDGSPRAPDGFTIVK